MALFFLLKNFSQIIIYIFFGDFTLKKGFINQYTYNPGEIGLFMKLKIINETDKRQKYTFASEPTELQLKNTCFSL